MVRFSGGRCVLTGGDLSTWLTAEIPAQGDDFAFVFHRTANVVKACRRLDGDLTLELTETGEGRERQLRLCMSCGDRAGEFRAFFSEDYPVMPELEPEQSFSANAASLMERINRIKYATRKPSIHTSACETSIQFSGSRIYCLDGLRAAWSTDEALSVPKPFMVTVPPLEHLKLFGKQDVSVNLCKRYIDVTDGSLHLITRLEEAVLFDLDSAVPTDFQEEVYVSPDEFLTELAYLKDLMPSGQAPYVRFCGGSLLTRADECGYQTKVWLEGKSEIEIEFNLNYMMDAFRQFKGESRVRMKLRSSISPMLLEAEERGDCALVLPVRQKYVPKAA